MRQLWKDFQEENIMEKRLQTLLNEKFGKNLDNCSQAELFQALMSLTKEEKEKFHRSCETLRSSFDGLGL